MVSQGAWFTWSNRQVDNPIAHKIDRAIVNKAWMNAFPMSSSVFDPPGESDHTLYLVGLSESVKKRKTPFKFFTFITFHPDFYSLLQEA